MLSKCINSKHMLAADTAQAAPQQSRCSARGSEKRRGALALARGAEGSGTPKGSGAAASRGGPAAPSPAALGTPRHGWCPLPTLFGRAWGLFPRHAVRGRRSRPASHRAASDGGDYCSSPRLLLAQEKSAPKRGRNLQSRDAPGSTATHSPRENQTCRSHSPINTKKLKKV